MNRHHVVAAVLAVVLGTGVACDYEDSQTPPQEGQNPGVDDPVALNTALAFVERATGTVFLVDGPGGRPRVRPVVVGRNPVAWVARPGQDQLLLLTQGHRGGGGVAPEGPALWIVTSTPTLKTEAVPLSSRFNALSVSPDGRFVITYFKEQGHAGENAEWFFASNSMGIVDLAKAPLRQEARLLRSLGGIPLGFDYSPPIGGTVLPDGDRRLVVIHSHNYLTLMDLENLQRPEISVPLTLPEDTRTLTPVQVKFDLADPTIYVRVEGASDVFALRLEPLPIEERQVPGNDFRPSLGQLAAGTRPRDMEIYNDEQGPRLLVVGDGHEVTIIDARSSRSLSVPLDHGAGRILRFSATAPGDPVVRHRALLVGTGGENRVTFVDLENFESLRTRNLQMRTMAGTVQLFQAFPSQQLALVQHGDRAGASVISLDKRTVTPLSSTIDISRLRTTAVLPHQVWILPTGRALLAHLDLKTLTVGEVQLDAPVADLMVTASPGAGSLLLVHPGREGYVTVLNAAAPDRQTARSLRGFAAANLLDRTERVLP